MGYRICRNALGKYKVQKSYKFLWFKIWKDEEGIINHLRRPYRGGDWGTLLFDTKRQARDYIKRQYNSIEEDRLQKIEDKKENDWVCTGEFL